MLGCTGHRKRRQRDGRILLKGQGSGLGVGVLGRNRDELGIGPVVRIAKNAIVRHLGLVVVPPVQAGIDAHSAFDECLVYSTAHRHHSIGIPDKRASAAVCSATCHTSCSGSGVPGSEA